MHHPFPSCFTQFMDESQGKSKGKEKQEDIEIFSFYKLLIIHPQITSKGKESIILLWNFPSQNQQRNLITQGKTTTPLKWFDLKIPFEGARSVFSYFSYQKDQKNIESFWICIIYSVLNFFFSLLGCHFSER